MPAAALGLCMTATLWIRVDHIGPPPDPCVNNMEARTPGCVQCLGNYWNGRGQDAGITANRTPVAARRTEIVLHVDNHQRAVGWRHRTPTWKVIRLSRNAHIKPLVLPP